MPEAGAVKLWHTLSVQDADAMITWLTAIGFTDHSTYRDDEDATVVHHASGSGPAAAG